MEFNISPETFVDQIDESLLPRLFIKDRYVPDIKGVGMIDGTWDVPHENKYSVAPNGTRYRRDIRGFLPIVIERVFLQRKDAKKKEFQAAKLATRAQLILDKRKESL